MKVDAPSLVPQLEQVVSSSEKATDIKLDASKTTFEELQPIKALEPPVPFRKHPPGYTRRTVPISPPRPKSVPQTPVDSPPKKKKAITRKRKRSNLRKEATPQEVPQLFPHHMYAANKHYYETRSLSTHVPLVPSPLNPIREVDGEAVSLVPWTAAILKQVRKWQRKTGGGSPSDLWSISPHRTNWKYHDLRRWVLRGSEVHKQPVLVECPLLKTHGMPPMRPLDVFQSEKQLEEALKGYRTAIKDMNVRLQLVGMPPMRFNSEDVKVKKFCNT
ncbi:unnamed protein product [Cyclocybe aegerita]|uniref:Uncharacterized protein n=1 Tax=Cyclocybe aegerita TaxID=1973307 RepID=A0A8S0W8I2_CYCAE|nr:unnamed protein product [Cyclocybe aegerita]